MLISEAKQAAEATVAKHCLSSDRTVVARIADVESRGVESNRGKCCKTLFIS